MVLDGNDDSEESKKNMQEFLKKIEEDEKQNKLSFEGIQNYALNNKGLRNLMDKW